MTVTHSLLVLSALAILMPPAHAQTTPSEQMLSGVRWSRNRVWNGRKEDSGAVHCLGNGRLCVYEQGPDIIQFFGPPYSTTTVGEITLKGDGISCISKRAWGTAVWQHDLVAAEKRLAVMTDLVAANLPCFVREIQADETITFVLNPESDLRIAAYITDAMKTQRAAGGMLLETPIGKPLVPFGRYPLPFAVFNQIAWKGNITLEQHGDAMHLVVDPGVSTLYLSGGPSLDECISNMEQSITQPVASLLNDTLSLWNTFTAQGKDFEFTLPKETPMRDRLIEVLDDVAVMIKAQQAAEGGVLAGYPYHLGYVRDQYGTHRGLVALGHDEMSRDILRFYFNIFEKGGMIRNAQAFDIPGVYHVHENDDVEITGYIMLQAFDYLQRSGDTEFILEIMPMLEWAFQVQQPHLVGNMLPFNGDETYVAGGILPRSALNDGSAEATLLFIESGNLLVDFVEKQGLWDTVRIEQSRKLIDVVKNNFHENFWQDNALITNNPKRTTLAAMPDSRHGVCESCITVQWTRRTANNRYVCVSCLNKDPLPAVDPTLYLLQSVSLTPLYFHAATIGKEELRGQVASIFAEYKRTGRLPSRPDGEVSVGYDYGLLLYAMTEIGHPEARVLFEKTLELADETGAWAEYYRDHKPTGTRCRPWESAINVEALLHWIEIAGKSEKP
jgi:hypothetical protein